MSLSPGATLGSFEISGLLGVGQSIALRHRLQIPKPINLSDWPPFMHAQN